MRTYQNQVAVEATIAQAAWGRLFRAATDAIADCFARRETRATAAEMVTGLLTQVDTRNCWTLTEALGHPGPHRLQHLLSRAKFDHDRAREEIARLVVGELAGQEMVLVADETGDAKSSTDCVGAGRQYSGAIKGVGLGYAVGVSHAHMVTDGAGRRWKAGRFINKVQPGQWMRMRTGHGTKGTREYDWAWLDVRADDTPDGHP